MQTLSLSDHKVYNYSDLSRSFIQNGLPNHQEEESAIKREWLLVYGQSSSLELPPPVPTHQLQLLRTPRKSGSHCLVSSAARAWPKNADPSEAPPKQWNPKFNAHSKYKGDQRSKLRTQVLRDAPEICSWRLSAASDSNLLGLTFLAFSNGYQWRTFASEHRCSRRADVLLWTGFLNRSSPGKFRPCNASINPL